MESYFKKQLRLIEKDCKGKTKDEQIKWLKEELADSLTINRICLDGWKSTLDSWRFSMKLGYLQWFMILMIGFMWGLILSKSI